MKLSQGELIMIWRRRCGMDYSRLGEIVFPKLSAKHVKVKKIEAGIQKATPAELKKIAAALDVTVEDLSPDIVNQGVCFNDDALEALPQLSEYVPLINAAARFEDKSILKKLMPEIHKMFAAA